MKVAWQSIFILIAMLLAGCATRGKPSEAVSPPTTSTTVADSRALMSLEQIEPRPTLGEPTTAPSEPPPLDALELFARARDARARGQIYNAINLLEQAIRLDAGSFELHFALGSAQQRAGNFSRAIESYERAAQIQPDDAVLQAELGRAYIQRGDLSEGIRHLRQARLTSEYASDPALACAVDYRLAVALQQGGYDRAALQTYEQVLRRLKNPSSSLRSHPEVAYLLNRPEFLVEQLGRLHEKQGQWDEAVQAYKLVAERQPDDFGAQARVVNTLSAAGRSDEAARGAVELVSRFKASPESLALLREVYRRAGRSEAAVEQLRRLHAQQPSDRTILFALADSLDAAGRGREGEELLLDAVTRRDVDVEILARLTQLQASGGALDRAARALIEAAARQPDVTLELMPLWSRLVSPGRNPTLRPADVRRITVGVGAEGAQLYFASRVAQAWNRPALAEQWLRQAVGARPIFAPAFRAMSADLWNSPGSDESRRRQFADDLIRAASDADQQSLATELTGLSLLAQRKFVEARDSLAEAIRLGGSSPELALSYARTVRDSGNPPRFEQLCRRLISDHPQFAPAYAELFRYYVDRGGLDLARRVLSTWLTNIPWDVDARLLEATVELRFNRRPEQSERILLEVYNEHPDRLDVLATLRAFYTESDRLGSFAELLEAQCAAHPCNFPATAQLVDVYLSQRRLADASRIVDAARAALRDDPDRLYFIAHLYSRLDQPALNEQVLEEVLRADPASASAANDLGYTWADGGRNLERAEALIRRAVESEPNNPAFLDSLGWVMYKLGRFEDARRYLEQAVVNSRPADPVVLDHLGDVLYRLNDAQGAEQQWRAALAQIGASDQREQNNALKLQVQQKLRQLQQNLPVSVAPVGSGPAPLPGQAKN